MSNWRESSCGGPVAKKPPSGLSSEGACCDAIGRHSTRAPLNRRIPMILDQENVAHLGQTADVWHGWPGLQGVRACLSIPGYAAPPQRVHLCRPRGANLLHRPLIGAGKSPPARSRQTELSEPSWVFLRRLVSLQKLLSTVSFRQGCVTRFRVIEKP